MNKSDIMKAAEEAAMELEIRKLHRGAPSAFYIKVLESLIAAAELLQQVEWQPIDSAPKDGTNVLLYPNWLVSSYDVALGGFAEWSDYWDDIVLLKRQPTHFMPLPQPPVIIENEGV